MVNHIAKGPWFGTGGLGRSCEFKTQHWLQIINGFGARVGVVAVRLVHQHHQVRQVSQVIEVGFAQILLQAAHLGGGGLGRALLVIPGADLGDVEDIDMQAALVAEQIAREGFRYRIVQAHAAPIFVVLAGDDHRRRAGHFWNPGKHVLGVAEAEILFQLLVDGQVRGQDQKVPAALGDKQPGDHRPHQSGFANARGQGEAQ
ncbi:hypothetical protein D3C85_1110900 [compost metagenome]